MNAPLAGISVVVTRPAGQAASFAANVREAGGTPILLPALEIEAVALDADARARLASDRFDWVIFTSANAVEFALRALAPPRVARVAAIGPATASALEARGIGVHAVPRTTTDSEG